jgi:hypothetical protein
MAMEVARDMFNRFRSYGIVRMFSDSQKALKQLETVQRKPGQEWVKEMVSFSRTIGGRGQVPVEFHWIAAHKKIEGR